MQVRGLEAKCSLYHPRLVGVILVRLCRSQGLCQPQFVVPLSVGCITLRSTFMPNGDCCFDSSGLGQADTDATLCRVQEIIMNTIFSFCTLSGLEFCLLLFWPIPYGCCPLYEGNLIRKSYTSCRGNMKLFHIFLPGSGGGRVWSHRV